MSPRGGHAGATLGRMTGPKKETSKDLTVEAEFLRKMVLGILSTLEGKGLLSSQEVDGIIRAARQAATPPAPKRLGGPAATTQWVRPGQAHQPLDRTTPVAIPNVQRSAPAAPAPATEPDQKPPVIDFDLQ